MIVVVMGVCGCGKTTIGQALAKELKWEFADADDFHSTENKEKMTKGIPLTDEDRIPWLIAMHEYMQRIDTEKKQAVVTCSALKKTYRKILLEGITEPVTPDSDSTFSPNTSIFVKQTPVHQEVDKSHDLQTGYSLCGTVMFLHLTGALSVLQSRLEARRGHFMPLRLLRSQLETLEPPDDSERHISLDINNTVESIVSEAVCAISQLSGKHE